MKRRSTGPDFVGVGVQRAGTSWLYQCLIEHPQVFMPRKEFHFFDRHYDQGTDWYTEQFEGAEDNQMRGEYTPDYLSSPEAIKRIHEYNPELKLLVILRNPLERAYSGYRLFQSHGHLAGKSFQEALVAQPQLLEKSLYSLQLDHLFDYFPRDSVFIGKYDDIVSSPSTLFASVCDFLGIDNRMRPKTLGTVKNASGFATLQARYRLPALQKAISRSYLKPFVTPLKNSWAAQKIKQKLIALSNNETEIYAVGADIQRIMIYEMESLENRLQIDCSKWRQSFNVAHAQ